MRHRVSLVAGLEGISRAALRIAKELTANSRSGLTVRFLSKKLELPEEEIEYLVELNHHLFFLDITRIKLVVEGADVVKRVFEGLENRGDTEALYRYVRNLDPPDFRQLEEWLGSIEPLGKKQAADLLVEHHYKHPESIVEYVATRNFSETARELFDVVWQSKDGVMPVSVLKSLHGGAETDVEQALTELFHGCALFEMFRFDTEDRLVRVVGLLAEIRQHREARAQSGSAPVQLKPLRKCAPALVDARGLDLSNRIARLVAAVAARPARLRNDGDLFREDFRRLTEIIPEDSEPSLAACLWIATGLGWLSQVDNELRAGDLGELIDMDRLDRHQAIYAWLMEQPNETASRKRLTALLDQCRDGAWYLATDFVRAAVNANAHDELPVLRSAGGHWHYISPSAAPNAERNFARSLEESFFWLGMVDRASDDGESVLRIAPLGRQLLEDKVDAGAVGSEAWTDDIVVQPNFDIVVPAHGVDPLLTVPLDQFADLQSAGAALVYRVSKESFTRAVQEGHDSDAFIEFLTRHNRGRSLPANVLHSLEDWRGGMKRVRLRTIHVIEAEDPLVLAELVHRRRFGKFLKHLDPEKAVIYRNITKDELAKVLEKEGFVVG